MEKAGLQARFLEYSRELRAKLGIKSRAPLAGKMGVTESYISQVETGKKPLTWQFLKKAVGAYLELSVELHKENIFPVEKHFAFWAKVLLDTQKATLDFSEITIVHKDNLIKLLVILLIGCTYPLYDNQTLEWIKANQCADELAAYWGDNKKDTEKLMIMKRFGEDAKYKRYMREGAEKMLRKVAGVLKTLGDDDEKISKAVSLLKKELENM